MEPTYSSINEVIHNQTYANVEKIHNLESRMAAHEAQCEERWKTTFNRLNDIDEGVARIESRLIAGGGATLLFLMGLLASHMM